MGGELVISRSAVVATLLLCLIAGCSDLVISGAALPPSELNPTYRKTVENYVRSTFKNYASLNNLEISDPRWVHSITGWTWMTCVRFQEGGHQRVYSLFLNDLKYSRYAVQTDACNAQSYVPLDRAAPARPGLLEPLY